MNLYFILFFILCFGHTFSKPNYMVFNFTQKVDHFNYLNNDTFNQKVVMSQKYLNEKNPPIFFYCGNEGKIMGFVNNVGLMWEIEDKFKAIIIFVEHRYYGSSFPKQISKKDYSYLSFDQALADYAYFLDNFRNTRENVAKSPIIAFGGSYGGMLASWGRVKYPHIFEGAIASSAPILQFPGNYDCLDFYRIVTKDYETYSKSCSNSIRKLWPAIRRLANTQDGLDFLAKELQLCIPLKNKKDVDALIDYFTNVIVNVAMVDYPNPTNFLKPMPRYPMGEICKILITDQLNDFDLVKQSKKGFYSIYFNYTKKAPSCINLNEDPTDLGADGWEYQSCTEAVMPICSDGTDLFEKSDFDLKKTQKICNKKFGVDLDVNKVRMDYSLKDLRAYSNIVFSNGDRDPWSAGGVLKNNYKKFGLEEIKGGELLKTLFKFSVHTDKNDEDIIFTTTGSIIINIPGACHHEDLRETGEFDTREVINARKYEIKIIQKWIRDYSEQFKN